MRYDSALMPGPQFRASAGAKNRPTAPRGLEENSSGDPPYPIREQTSDVLTGFFNQWLRSNIVLRKGRFYRVDII